MTTRPDQETGATSNRWRSSRRWRVLLSATTVASLLVVGLVAGPSQAQTTVCTGNISNIITPGDLQVPDGQACVLTMVLVTGNANVGAGSDLFLIDSTVAGGLAVGTSGFAQVTDSTVNNGSTLLNSFALLAEGSTLSDGVDVDGGMFFGTGTNVNGAVDSSNGWTYLENGQVSGYLTTDQDNATDLFDLTMAGSVTVDRATTGSVICRSTFSGAVTVTRSDGLIQLGGEAPTPLCGSNVLTGGVTLTDNTADEVLVASNLILGNVSCSGNSASPAGSGNLILGTAGGQCAGLGAASFGAEPAPDGATQTERRDAILAALADRGGSPSR